ncbi:MAG: hypothetical protein QHI38_10675, partial [Armatimonadota bacterium]|nr:hypothetical protein [Armatimonadota bacterium]
AVFILFLLVGLNALLNRFRPSAAFTRAELLAVYAMTVISAALAGHDMLPNLVGMMVYPWWYATPENGWDRFVPFLPRWLSVSDPNAVRDLFLGGSDLYRTGYWLLWLKPVLWWLAFTVVLVFVMCCINTIVRQQWTHRERLTFPIVQLPLAMTEPGGTLWRTRIFWLGFGIAFAVDLLNGIAVWVPSLPRINVGFEGHDLTGAITNKPWSALGWTPYTFYPFVIGIAYLLPTDLIFSCWFFYWFWKAEAVFVSAMGWDSVPTYIYTRNQAWGGLLAIIVTLAWTSRGYLKQVWRRIAGYPSELDDSAEAMSYRSAALGALAGLAFLAYFMKRIGMSPLVAVAAFILYFVLALALARIRAELGPPVHDFHFSGPDFAIPSFTGLSRLSNGDLVGLCYFWWFNRAYRSHPMPIVAENSKIADSAGAQQRKFLAATLFAVALGTIATFWSYLHVGYRLGFERDVALGGQYAYGGFKQLANWWTRPKELMGPNWAVNFSILGGFLFCMLLSYIRLTFINFPFHPIGFAVTASWAINIVWVPLLIAWLIKSSVLRFGGLRQYRLLLPFFLGLILGGMTIGCIWGLVGVIFRIPYYNFWGA